MELLILTMIFLCVNSSSLDMNAVCHSQSVIDVRKNITVTNLTELCNSKPCVTKCCDIDYFFYFNTSLKLSQCVHKDDFKRILDVSKVRFDFSDFAIYKLDASRKAVLSEKSLSDFNLVVNKNFLNTDCRVIAPKLNNGSYLLEDGCLGLYSSNSYEKWLMINSPNYCIEKVFFKKKRTNTTGSNYIQILLKEFEDVRKDRSIFTGVAMVISAFFMVLVLIVYCILKQLRNIQGMVLMGYVSTLLFGYIFKAILVFGILNGTIRLNECRYLSPICYGILLSSFFWLKIMSFDIWWTFRATRKIRSIHRQGELMKFMWYGLYAWGTPAAIAVTAYFIDNADVDLIKPKFETCFRAHNETLLYLFLPILIVTVINTLLFLMTIYNIWLINRAMAGFEPPNMGTNEMNQNRFCLYIKVSLLMGVSWIFELIQILKEDIPDWLYILLNVYNVFIGVALFFMFVFKRSIFIKLCKKLNINNKFARSFNVTSNSRNTEHSGSGKSKSKNTMETVELDDIKSDVENTVVN